MRQYTTTEQTAKLIELGFDKPMWRVARKFDEQPPRKAITSFGVLMTASYEDVFAYFIGDLMEMLPNTFTRQGVPYGLSVSGGNAMGIEGNSTWVVSYLAYGPDNNICIVREELIDALYCMLVKLKEEGVI